MGPGRFFEIFEEFSEHVLGKAVKIIDIKK
jgi:hypothetical protein